MINEMVASTSAHDVRLDRGRSQPRKELLAYTQPGLEVPKFIISSQYGPPIESELDPLARALYYFDQNNLRRISVYHQKQKKLTDEVQKAESIQWISWFLEVKRQWKDIESGGHQFCWTYMRGNALIAIWSEGLRIVKSSLSSNISTNDQGQKRREYVRILDEYDTSALVLQEELLAAAQRSLLTKEILDSIQCRWVRLDEVLRWYYNNHNRNRDGDGLSLKRKSNTWTVLRKRIEESDPGLRISKPILQAQRSNDEVDKAESSPIIQIFKVKVDTPFVLWSALSATIIISTILFAQGYALSPNTPGTTHSPDFWFLLQSSATQLLSLIISALLEYKSGKLPLMRWACPAAIASVCTVAAGPMYVVVPMKWSSFLSAVGGATQVFMLLQHFLSPR